MRVVFWGTGIVFFLAKFINLHNEYTQGFWVELCQQVETGMSHSTCVSYLPSHMDVPQASSRRLVSVSFRFELWTPTVSTFKHLPERSQS